MLWIDQEQNLPETLATHKTDIYDFNHSSLPRGRYWYPKFEEKTSKPNFPCFGTSGSPFWISLFFWSKEGASCRIKCFQLVSTFHRSSQRCYPSKYHSKVTDLTNNLFISHFEQNSFRFPPHLVQSVGSPCHLGWGSPWSRRDSYLAAQLLIHLYYAFI